MKYGKLYKILEESIDWSNAKTLPLELNKKTNFIVDGYPVAMMIEPFDLNYKHMLHVGSILYNDFNPNTYYNFGFDINDKTYQQYKTNYRILSKILGIVVKSLFNWIKNNNPEVVIIFADSQDIREKRKKLSIYGSILQGNENYLHTLGYSFDGNMGTEFLVIRKIKQYSYDKDRSK